MKILDYLRQNIERYPEGIFLVSGDESYSYSQFYDKMNQFSARLKALGIGKGDNVGIMLPNIPEWIIAYYSILKIGAVVVPINIMLKDNEIKYLLTDSGAKSVIFWDGFSSDVMKAATGSGCNILIKCGGSEIEGIHEFGESVPHYDRQDEESELNEDDTCVIIYTPGTTGKPMGVELSQKAVVENALSCSILLPVGPSDTIIGVLPLFHSFGHTAVMNLTMVIGAKLVLVQRFEPLELSKMIKSLSPSLFFGVPSMYHAILNDKRIEADSFQKVKYCISGAAKLAANLLKDFENKFNCVILEGYGLPEAGPVVSFNKNASLRRPGSIGFPIDGVEMNIFDDDGNEIDRGQIGEIVVRGESVMKGYLNDPDATKRSFINGWLRTGDLARVDDEGYYYIVDRKSDLIIKHGFNVYPKEIENELLTHPDIKECSVIGIRDDAVGEKIKVYVVPANGNSMNEEEITKYCSERMAAYKVPDIVEIIAGLPKNASGKVLKKSLRMLHKY